MPDADGGLTPTESYAAALEEERTRVAGATTWSNSAETQEERLKAIDAELKRLGVVVQATGRGSAVS